MELTTAAHPPTSRRRLFVRIYGERTRKGFPPRQAITTSSLRQVLVPAQAPSVFVHPESERGNMWLGFGGSFTEASATTLLQMSTTCQEEVLAAYFGPTGLNYNLGRLHIGSCDFCLENWTCGSVLKNDVKLRGFNIDRYRQAIIPMLRRAFQLAGAPLQLMASPWTPLPWMKSNNAFSGGSFLPEWSEAWALHFVKFIEQMKFTGIPIWAISVQNEAEAEQVWESCKFTGEQEASFVRDHLGPALEKAGLSDVKIMVWDHNRDGMLERAAIAYGDARAAKYIWGVAYHWYGDARFESWPSRYEVHFDDRQSSSQAHYINGRPVVREVRSHVSFENVRLVAELYPDKHIIQTECCQELDGKILSNALDDWKLGERYAMNIIADLNSGCEGWIDWNLCLNLDGGPNHKKNYCVAPIVCDTGNDKVLLQPCYWYLRHFSAFIKPGARRLVASTSRDVLEVTAFKNPDGSLAVVVLNQSESNLDFWMKIYGSGNAQVSAPRRSVSSFVVDYGDIASEPDDAANPQRIKTSDSIRTSDTSRRQSQHPSHMGWAEACLDVE